MNLRTRITIFVTVTFALLVVGLGFASYRRAELESRRAAEALVTGQERVWQKVVEKICQELVAHASLMLRDPALVQAIAKGDEVGLAARVATGIQPLRQAFEIAAVEIVDYQGRSLYSSRSSVAARTLADAGLVSRIVEYDQPATGVEREEDGRFLAIVSLPVRGPSGVAGVLTLARPILPVLNEVKAATASEIFLTDPRGGLVQGTNQALWQGLSPPYESLRGGTATLKDGDRVWSLVSGPLSSATGARLGTQVAISDVTESYDREAWLRIAPLIGIGLFLVVILIALQTFLQRAFRPLESALAGLNALSQGDLSVDVVGVRRRDEIGRIARAVRIFRDHQQAIAQQGFRRERQEKRQRRFIRQQMEELAGTLDDEARAEMMSDLDRIERQAPGSQGDLGTLAIAVQVMAERVRSQHQNLDSLVAELREALKSKTELAALQQQFEMAGKMQAEMLPAAFPPRDDLQVRGALRPAEEFGGEFYDFFAIGPDQIAVVAGQIMGTGLASAFFTLTARTLVKTTMMFGLSPCETLMRVNDMLATDNRQGLSVALFVGVLDTSDGRFLYSSGDYPAPFLVRTIGAVAPVPTEPNWPMAERHGLAFQEQVLELPARGTLVLYSRGLIGTTDSAGEPFGKDRLASQLASFDDLSAASIVDGVMDALDRHDGGARQRDATCLALRYMGASKKD